MKGDPKVVELLNEALKEELTAINQYWLHYRMLDNWGVDKLAQFERHRSVQPAPAAAGGAAQAGATADAGGNGNEVTR